MIQVASHLKDCIILHVSFLEVEFIILSLLRGNPANQKVLYNCCIHGVVDVLESACSSIRPRVENLIAFMMGENSSDSSVPDLNSELMYACNNWSIILANFSNVSLSDFMNEQNQMCEVYTFFQNWSHTV